MKLGLTLAVALSAFGLALASNQDTAPKAELKLDKLTGVAGTTLKGKVLLTFADGLHGYQNPPSQEFQIPVKVEAVKGTTLGKISYPKGAPFLMAGEEKPAMVYEGAIQIPVEVKLGTKAGKQVVKMSVSYQQCNESSCYPPGSIDLSATVTVTAAPKKKTK